MENLTTKNTQEAELTAKEVAALPRPHHPFSPSKLQFLEVTPNFVGLNTDSEASLRGTAQHTAAEGVRGVIQDDLSDSEAEAVELCKQLRDETLAKYPGGKIFQELKLRIDDYPLDFEGVTHIGTTSGYADVCIVSEDGKSGEVLDWKFGAWSVEPANNNLQGYAYALGLKHAYPDLESIRVTFFSPHRKEITSHTFTTPDFLQMYIRVCFVVARAHYAQRTKDFSGCRVVSPNCLFCANKAICPKLGEFAIAVSKKFAPLKVPEHVTPSTFAEKSAVNDTMAIAQLMEAWGRAMRTQITDRVVEDEGFTPEGYQLRSRANRVIADKEKVIANALEAGLTPEQIEKCKTLSVVPLYAAIRAKAPRGEKELAEDNFRDKLIAAGAVVEDTPTIFLERKRS